MSTSEPARIRAVDVFAGVGGSSLGARNAGVEVVAAIDNWALARKTYLDNFQNVTFYRRRCETVSPGKIQKEFGRIQLLIASPECTSHTCAKGKSRPSEESRKTAFQVIRFAKRLNPRWIVVENVIQMKSWRRYDEWLNQLKLLGYHVREQVLNAADFGVPQSRKRLYVICDAKRTPQQLASPKREKVPARRILDFNGTYRYSLMRSANRAEATLKRAERAIAALG